MQAGLRAGLHVEEFWEMDPDETQMFIDAYWWRWEMEDRMQAHYASQHLMAAGVKKDKVKPKKIKFLAEWQSDSDDDVPEFESEQPAVESKKSPTKPQKRSSRTRAEDDKAAFKRLKEYSKQRAREHRG